MIINNKIANKNHNIRATDVVFEVEYLGNECVKKERVNANVVLYDWPNFRYPLWFCF